MSALRIVERPSPNHEPRRAEPRVLVLHYTGMIDGAAALARLRDPRAKVSAHYVVEIDGTVFRLVDEERAAWHAGVSVWRGRRGLNAHSIGIEIVNGGHDFGLPAYPRRQIDVLCRLAGDVLRRWPIAPTDVVGHSDIAPMRKRDPGERLPWRTLAGAGIGLWPEEVRAATPCPVSVTGALARIGYTFEDAPQPTAVPAALSAFQRRFTPDGPIDGRADARVCRRLREVDEAYRVASGGR